jgi:hypothetical protein
MSEDDTYTNTDNTTQIRGTIAAYGLAHPASDLKTALVQKANWTPGMPLIEYSVTLKEVMPAVWDTLWYNFGDRCITGTPAEQLFSILRACKRYNALPCTTAVDMDHLMNVRARICRELRYRCAVATAAAAAAAVTAEGEAAGDENDGGGQHAPLRASRIRVLRGKVSVLGYMRGLMKLAASLEDEHIPSYARIGTDGRKKESSFSGNIIHLQKEAQRNLARTANRMTPDIIATTTSGFSYASYHGLAAAPIAPLSAMEVAVKKLHAPDMRAILLDEAAPQTLYSGEAILRAKMTAGELDDEEETLPTMVMACWAASGAMKLKPEARPYMTAAKVMKKAAILELLLVHAGTDVLPYSADALKKIKLDATKAQRFTEVQAASLDDAAPFPIYLIDLLVRVWETTGYQLESAPVEAVPGDAEPGEAGEAES